MKTNQYVGRAVIGSLLLVGSSLWAGEEHVALNDVPATVIKAAKAEVDGLEITSAEVEKKRSKTVYEIVGTADGVKYEVEVTADGQVLEVEIDD